MDSKKIKKILKEIPLRISITDYCNLNCFFCSNEGMDLDLKNTSQAKIKDLIFLLKLLKDSGLRKVSITGGDPTCYPELKQLLKEINELKFEETFFHTNGIALDKELIEGELENFTKVAISIHTLNFIEWEKMTKGTKEQFDRMLKNLELISEKKWGRKVEIKMVPIKGINDSQESIKKVLNLCNASRFRFKFLIFEPIKESHRPLIVSIDDIFNILKKLGATQIPKQNFFRGQENYLPINRYGYKSTQGVLIEIGCGKKEVCKSCFKSNEIFITPKLEIKPCHANSHVICLKNAILSKNKDEILKRILESRCFLKTSPGKNKKYWSQN